MVKEYIFFQNTIGTEEEFIVKEDYA